PADRNKPQSHRDTEARPRRSASACARRPARQADPPNASPALSSLRAPRSSGLLRASVSPWFVRLRVLSVLLRPRRRADPSLAERAAAAAAGGAGDQVPSVRDPDPAQWPAGRGGAAPRAAGGDDAPAGAQRYGVGSEGQARTGAP